MTKPAPTRVLFCTSGGLYGALVLRRLLADPRLTLSGLVLSSRVLGRQDDWLHGVQGLYRRSGLRYLLYLWAATGLAELLGRLGALPPAAVQARRVGCPVLVTRDINDREGEAFVERCAPELLVSAFFNQRIAAPLLQRPTAGAVNIHPSLLPALKGVDPVFHGRLRGVTPLGVTLHRMVATLDSGPVLAQASCDMAAGDSVLAITARLFERGAGLLLEQLPGIIGGAAGVPQPDSGEYDSWPSPRQVASLRQGGTALVRAADLRLMAGRGPVQR